VAAAETALMLLKWSAAETAPASLTWLIDAVAVDVALSAVAVAEIECHRC
jgi:hypothetical protein